MRWSGNTAGSRTSACPCIAGRLELPLATYHGLPDGLLECEAVDLEAVLGTSALIDIPGARQPPLFVSVLLHGNETSGWDGLRRYLERHPFPPRRLLVFVGNVAAARAGVRTLPQQVDYNRIWRNASGPGGALAAALMGALADREIFAAVDLHNNTGHNPYYSVLTDLTRQNFGLAYLFSDKAVYVEEPDTVLTRAFAGRCPAVALEVGPVGDPRCAPRVTDFLERCLALAAVPEIGADRLELYRSLARVHVVPDATFGFEGDSPPADRDLMLTGGMEAVNFHRLRAGTAFGVTGRDLLQVLSVRDAGHRDVTTTYLELSDGTVRLKRDVVPAMYTTDPVVIRQDCLCYFMERMS